MQREIQPLSVMELFCPQRCRHAFKHCCASMNWQWGNHHHEVHCFIFMFSWFSCYDWWNGAPLNWYPKISISQVFTSPVTTYQTRKQALAILIIFLMAGQSLAKRINHLLYTLTPYLLLNIYIYISSWFCGCCLTHHFIKQIACLLCPVYITRLVVTIMSSILNEYMGIGQKL